MSSMNSTFCTRSLRRLLAALSLLLLSLSVRGAAAEPPSSAAASNSEDGDTAAQRARELFSTGTALAKRMQWSEALSAFQGVARIRPHPVVTFNVGICERALGRYARARATFARVLEATRSEA